jgi:hypothetical protein
LSVVKTRGVKQNDIVAVDRKHFAWYHLGSAAPWYSSLTNLHVLRATCNIDELVGVSDLVLGLSHFHTFDLPAPVRPITLHSGKECHDEISSVRKLTYAIIA